MVISSSGRRSHTGLDGRDDALTRVKRVARYTSFVEMLDAEGVNINPDSPREQQLANIRRIYGPEKEALGVLVIEIETHRTTGRNGIALSRT